MSTNSVPVHEPAEKPQPTSARGKWEGLTPMEESLRARVRAVCVGMSYRTLSEVTGTSTETVRRYMNGFKPSAIFLARICHAFEISPVWLLLGREAPLEREGLENKPIEDQLEHLTAHMRGLRAEVEELAGTSGSKSGVSAPSDPSPPAKGTMNTQHALSVRLLLGPADGQVIKVSEPLGEEIIVRLDAKHPHARMIEQGASVDAAAKLYRYRRVRANVYSWINPQRDRG